MNRILFYTLKITGAIIAYSIAFNIMDLEFWKEIGIALLFLFGNKIQDAEGGKNE